MNIVRFLFLFAILSLSLQSCGDDDTPESQTLEEFVGIYDCIKYNSIDLDPTFASEQELEVKIDPDNDENLLIGANSVPVDEEGSYGPDFLTLNLQYTVRFDGDSIEVRLDPILENGIALPCIFIGTKRN